MNWRKLPSDHAEDVLPGATVIESAKTAFLTLLFVAEERALPGAAYPLAQKRWADEISLPFP
jgi:hypothetical protein